MKDRLSTITFGLAHVVYGHLLDWKNDAEAAVAAAQDFDARERATNVLACVQAMLDNAGTLQGALNGKPQPTPTEPLTTAENTTDTGTETTPKDERVRRELARVINCNSLENGSDTPDCILADFVADVINVWNGAVKRRDKWYGRDKTLTEHLIGSTPCELTPVRHDAGLD